LSDFDQLEALHPLRIVPSHGMMGDAALIDQQRTVMKGIQARAAELKREGKTVDESAGVVQTEFQTKYANWAAPARIAIIARTAFTEAP